MTILEIIDKKKNKQELAYEEINYAVNGYVNGEIPDYQMSALLMAIVINDMTEKETIDLTEIMLKSGDIINLDSIDGIKIDKHSTGGVGDKTTIILGPLVASCGVKVAKMSGRGLGHTGGTIDKLESIKGFNTSINLEQFTNQVNEVGIAIASQTGNLVPADKKIYALRDVTSTVDSIPLIASSIMSKKLASGADKLVIDIKVGNGALVKDVKNAKKLANLMIKIGQAHNKETICFLTNMDQPLGNAVGNSLEIIESIDVLKGNGPSDLTELVIELGSMMVSLGKKITYKKAKQEIEANLKNNKAYEKFEQLVQYQNGDINELITTSKIFSIKSPKQGYVKTIDALKIGEICRKIGAGRLNKDDQISHGVGIVLSKKVGDFVNKDDELMKVYLDQKNIALNELIECFNIDNKQTKKQSLIYEIMR